MILAGEGHLDPLARILPGFPTATLAVYAFFAISGYLVTGSLLHDRGLWRYLRNRFLRVYPGYLVCILITVVVIGPAFTSWSVDRYFESGGAWEYLRDNLLPVSFAWTLPGVFEANPYPGVVNGTLWSLGLEVRWYFYLALLAVVGAVGRKWPFTILGALFLLFGAWEACTDVPDPLHYRALSQTFVLAGLAVHWLQREALPGWPLILIIAAAVALAGTAAQSMLIAVGAVYGTLWVAYSAPHVAWPPRLDYSYGTFLYGFPVQQGVVAFFPAISGLQLFAVTLPLVACCAAASWHFVERPSLTLKARAKPLPAV